MAAAVAASEYDPVYPSRAVQQAEETQTLKALVQAAAGRRVRCPVVSTPRKIRDTQRRVARWNAARVAAAQSAGLSAAAVTAAAFTNVAVDTYWFIYQLENGTGYVSDSVIDAQMRVMDKAYAGSGFSFVKRGTRRIPTSLANFQAGTTTKEEAANKAVRQGGGTTLNCYTWALPDGLLGWAVFPVDYSKSTSNRIQDGVVVHYGSLPRGFLKPYDEGDTLVHEVRMNDVLQCGQGMRPRLVSYIELTPHTPALTGSECKPGSSIPKETQPSPGKVSCQARSTASADHNAFNDMQTHAASATWSLDA
jgi:hypothetical protein